MGRFGDARERHEAAVCLRAICPGGRDAGGAEQQGGGETVARGIQASGGELSPRIPDYAARERSPRCVAGGGGTLHRDGRPLWAQLLPTGGGLVQIFAAR